MGEVEVKEFGKHIVADPRICHGQWTFRGTRIMVWQRARAGCTKRCPGTPSSRSGGAPSRGRQSPRPSSSHARCSSRRTRMAPQGTEQPRGHRMNLLDENVPRRTRRKLLRRQGVRIRQIGHDIGRLRHAGSRDPDACLHSLKRVTLFTLDSRLLWPASATLPTVSSTCTCGRSGGSELRAAGAATSGAEHPGETHGHGRSGKRHRLAGLAAQRGRAGALWP